MTLCEIAAPARITTEPFAIRWFGNVAVFVLGWLMMLPIPFLTAMSLSFVARDHGWGILNLVHVPALIAVPMSVVALDLIAYWEHRVFHWFLPVWRLHALHHSDPDIDVATFVRHHPGEIVVESLIDGLMVIVFGFDAVSLTAFTVLTGVVQMAAHANVADSHFRWLSSFLVTPEFHRVHHSREFDENNSNFSNVFSVWDRIFGTNREAHATLQFGLPGFTEAKFQRVDRMLLLPLMIGADQSSGAQQA